jgi:hypothetical protein
VAAFTKNRILFVDVWVNLTEHCLGRPLKVDFTGRKPVYTLETEGDSEHRGIPKTGHVTQLCAYSSR